MRPALDCPVRAVPLFDGKASAMSNLRQLSPARSVRRRRERPLRRLGLEALERRDCPAVMFDFDLGVLRITGDDGPNVVEIAQWSDGDVEVLSDGERHTFEGVNKVFARTGDGDDQTSVKYTMFLADGTPVRSSLPLLLDLNTGAGNDTTRIDDGLITFRDLNDVRSLADINNGSANGGRNDEVVILHSSIPGGAASVSDLYVRFGCKPTTSWSFDAQIITGAGDDKVSILTRNVDNLMLDINTGSGGDDVRVHNQPQPWFQAGPAPVSHHVPSTQANATIRS